MKPSPTDTRPVEIPPEGDYRIDLRNSTLSFTTRHLFGLGPVRGTFAIRDGHIHVAEPIGGSSARATIAAAGVRTGNSARDAAVRSARYLDAEHHPDITFASTGVDEVDGRWVLHGLLTVHGHTHALDVRIERLHTDGAHLRLRAGCTVDRYQFGITAMKGMAARRLTMRLDVTADRAQPG